MFFYGDHIPIALPLENTGVLQDAVLADGSYRGGRRPEHFRCYFAMGKIRGNPCMRSHISLHRATAKYFSN
jgi:hypothetical protein